MRIYRIERRQAMQVYYQRQTLMQEGTEPNTERKRKRTDGPSIFDGYAKPKEQGVAVAYAERKRQSRAAKRPVHPSVYD